MSYYTNIQLKIPDNARAKDSEPLMQMDKFINYCKSNNVNIDKKQLEAFEKEKLIFPCFRTIYPVEYMAQIKEFIPKSPLDTPIIDNKYEDIDNLERHHIETFCPDESNIERLLKCGHPLEYAYKCGNPYVFLPVENKFVPYDSYVVTCRSSSSQAISCDSSSTFYAPWKVHFVQALNYNCALTKRRLELLDDFQKMFPLVSMYLYRLHLIWMYVEHRKVPEGVRKILNGRNDCLAFCVYQQATPREWKLFLLKLIEICVDYANKEKYLLREEVKKTLATTVEICMAARNENFESTVGWLEEGFSKRYIDYSDNIWIYTGELENILYPLHVDFNNLLLHLLKHKIDHINGRLSPEEKYPNHLIDNLVCDQFAGEQGCALYCLLKLYRMWNQRIPWNTYEVWNAIKDIAISIEYLGKAWLGKYGIESIVRELHPSYDTRYGRLVGGYTVKDQDTFLKKIEILKDYKEKTCSRQGNHVLVTKLIRHYSTHGSPINYSRFQKYYGFLVDSLEETLFMLFARYKGY